MPPDKYKKFGQTGYFTIRCSNRFWSRVWTDMIIEQDLMHLLNSRGGLTHERD